MATGTQQAGLPFQQAVLDRLGIMPNALLCAPEAPEIAERFWDFVKGMFIDNPIASLFKERLFVYLSRFCEFRYCIVRHCGFLVGRGHASGDPVVEIETVAQVIRLLKIPTPWQRDMNAVLLRLEAISTPIDWPEPETELEDCLFAATTAVYVEPRLRDRERAALRNALGGQRFEYLIGLLTLIRAAHYWTVAHHPALSFEDDVRHMLEQHDELARLLLEDPEASRSEMGVRLFNEVELLRDLNKQLELEKAKQALEARYREAEIELARVSRLTTMGELAGSIAHEVNQPLTAIMNNGSACLRLLANSNLDPEVLRLALEEIVADGSRANAVITRIRAFIKKKPAEKSELDINEVIQEVLALASHEVRKNGAAVECELKKTLPLVQADRVQLQQVLLNLIMNGIEAMTAVTDRPRMLWVESRVDDSGDVLVSVRDSGIGLGSEADRVFTPFFTTKANGMGMGLSISRSLIDDHGGRLWAAPNSPHGAVFSFTLPAAAGSPS
jgi:C4-dicarboxylate-specific signal transduction histidine kinase